jgi:two-component system response regulator
LEAKQVPPILVVDDHPEDLLLAQRALRQCKVLNPVHVFARAEECLQFFDSLSERDPVPCILFLDLVMTPMSGVQLLQALRQKRAGREALVVMLSGMGDLKAVHEGYQLGAQTFLIKPLTSEDILQLVANLSRRLRCEKVNNGYVIYPIANSASSNAPRPGLAGPAETRRDRLPQGASEPSAN